MAKVSFNEVAQTILEEALQVIIHNIVIHRHREHKMLLASLDPTTKLPHCSDCNLPRLLDPPLAPKVRGATSDPPANTTYCDRKPWIRRPGHDIYGNPFLKSDVTGRPLTKKEREAKKKEDGEDGPDTGGPPSPSQEDNGSNTAAPQKLEKGEKKASKIDEKLKKGEYVPWHTCPSCKRSLLITRFAKHLEQCMGLSGRAASRNAMAKMNGSGSGTPGGSRGGTPGPGSQDGGGGERGEKDGDNAGEAASEEDTPNKPQGVRKKLLKKGLKEKAKKETSNGKLPKSLSKSNSSANLRSSPVPSSAGGESKRDRSELGEDEEDETSLLHVKKRQKLQRVGSVASVVSQSTVGGGGDAMERSESLEGSLLEDGED
ncbi:uncharacterized protein MYCGRDRAFT_109240 [Zymoseptoria tritici IPO323]|uniref:SAGA-associated factor 11 n=1 Tax=Zymoseptoria tritici (strain CBS 115943 / IPO323) TaxID=336722 RepID=F9XA28_ZYMTI|nr:uncharacterized protein MYCGRDRAFT_109240 [Zymoseptoria tritici IPO323]EGP88076.1 hypothetical protein MYCGRDRAFT_109240 [Zymoseptoria tritici IPO323]